MSGWFICTKLDNTFNVIALHLYYLIRIYENLKICSLRQSLENETL